jgi:hypothetical protein
LGWEPFEYNLATRTCDEDSVTYQSQNFQPQTQSTTTTKILALDLGKFNTMCCFFDSKTRKHTFLNAATERNYLETVFKKHKIDLTAMEACGPSGCVNDLAINCAHKTIVVLDRRACACNLQNQRFKGC